MSDRLAHGLRIALKSNYPGDTSAEGVTRRIPRTRIARGRTSISMSRRLIIELERSFISKRTP